MEEIWKDIIDYEGLYQVSNLGRVKSLHHNKEKILKNRLGANGYYSVALNKNGKIKYLGVHRLVAIAFVDGYKEELVVNHIDENPLNNIYTNLEWTSHKENVIYSKHKWTGEKNGNYNKYGKDSKRYNKGKKILCIETGDIFLNAVRASESIKSTPSAIRNSIYRNSTSKGYHWKYID